jgi:hypothetical protein
MSFTLRLRNLVSKIYSLHIFLQYSFFNFLKKVRLSPSETAASVGPTVHPPDDRWLQWSVSGMIID